MCTYHSRQRRARRRRRHGIHHRHHCHEVFPLTTTFAAYKCIIGADIRCWRSSSSSIRRRCNGGTTVSDGRRCWFSAAYSCAPGNAGLGVWLSCCIHRAGSNATAGKSMALLRGENGKKRKETSSSYSNDDSVHPMMRDMHPSLTVCSPCAVITLSSRCSCSMFSAAPPPSAASAVFMMEWFSVSKADWRLITSVVAGRLVGHHTNQPQMKKVGQEALLN